MITARQLHFLAHGTDRVLHRAAEIAAAHAVLDRDIALIAFAVNFGSSVALFDLAQLRERNALSRGSKKPDIFQCFLSVAELREIAHDEVIALFVLQNLRECVATRRGLNRVLNVGDIDLITRGGLPVDDEVVVRLADHAKHAEILDSLHLTHHATI